MDPVHITKGDENAQEKVDACLARLRQMMLDSDNAWEFDMLGTGTGAALARLVVTPKNPPKPKTENTAEAVASDSDPAAPAAEPAPTDAIDATQVPDGEFESIEESEGAEPEPAVEATAETAPSKKKTPAE